MKNLNKNNQIIKKTARKWSELLNIKFKNLKGFTSEESFRVDLIDKETFLNLALNCDLEVNIPNSRRDIGKMKKMLEIK